MRIKSFTARTSAEALQQIQAEMGPDAVILQTRPLRDRGLLGLLKRTGVEIVAGIDEPAPVEQEAPEVSPQIERLRDRLLRHGIDDSIVEELLDDVEQVSAGQPPAQEGRLTEALAKALGSKVRMTGGLSRNDTGPRVIAFVGPTGVGKTTTIAKLAAELVLNGRHRVELVTIDAHRVGAIEQLKAYGELLSVPVHTAYTPEDLADAVAKASRAEFVLIDTPGCSYGDRAALAELRQYFRQVPGLEVNVLLSCCWRSEDAVRAANAFRPTAAGAARLLFTKIDETVSYGTLLTVPERTHLPLSYISNGQNVPDDIRVGTPHLLATLLAKRPSTQQEVTL